MSKLFNFTYLLFLLQITLNFFSSPLVSYLYAVIVLFVVIQIFILPRNESLWSLVFLILIEGQGRVVWGYHPIVRILFDLTCVLFVAKSISESHRLFHFNKIPRILSFFIMFHFIWWVLELFNPEAAGVLPSFATSKYYIFPILLFSSFLSVKQDYEGQVFHRNLFRFFFYYGLICGLSIYQNEVGIKSLTDITQNYVTLFPKYKIFADDLLFRPWGTSYLPGGMSAFMYLSVGFFFIAKEKIAFHNKWIIFLNSILRYLFLVLLVFSTFITQVRSNFLKVLLIIFILGFFKFLISKKKFLRVMTFCGALIFAVHQVNQNPFLKGQIEGSLSRFEALALEGVSKQRSGVVEIAESLKGRWELPFGFGLGMTSTFLPAFQQRREQRVNIPMPHFWNMDNLYMSLLLELGVGGFFYIGFIISVMLTLLAGVKNYFRVFKDTSTFFIVMVSSATFFTLMIGSWGAAGFLFNPESFFCWLWVSMAYSAMQKMKENTLISSETTPKES